MYLFKLYLLYKLSALSVSSELFALSILSALSALSALSVRSIVSGFEFGENCDLDKSVLCKVICGLRKFVLKFRDVIFRFLKLACWFRQVI